MTATMRLLTNRNREFLKNGDVVQALILTATDLEFFLFSKLFFEKRIKIDLMDHWTLGRYVQWNIKLVLVDKKWSKTLQDFVRLRNLVAHSRLFSEKIKGKDSSEKVEKLISDVVDFLDTTEIKYENNMKLDKEYYDYLAKVDESLEKYLNEKI